MIPKHYDKPVTPWMLEEHMESSGDAFVDARRSDAIEYAFRMKGDLLEDLKKARHCLDAAIGRLDAKSMGTPCPATLTKWRMLQDGEVMKLGDEFLASDSAEFEPIPHLSSAINSVWSEGYRPTRRRVTPDLSELNQHITELLKHE